jgi:hypothetical protein
LSAKLSILSINSDREKEKEEGEEEREEEVTDFMLTDNGARSKYAVMRVFSSSPSLPSLTSNTIELPGHHKHDSKLSLTYSRRNQAVLYCTVLYCTALYWAYGIDEIS